MKLLKDYWLPIVAGLALLALAAWVMYTPQPPPPLSPAAENAVQATITRNQERAGRDTTRAKAAAASATTNYQAGKAYAAVGAILHQQSKLHAKPTPSGDTAASRLQRQLAAY